MESSEREKPLTFEEQYRSKKTLKFKEGEITVARASPEELNDETPVLIAPGWGENSSTYKKTSQVFFNEGRDVWSVGYSRRGGEVIPDERYPEAELRKAMLLLQAIEGKGVEKVDVIAHSEGAINVLIAAMIDPDKFRNIVLDKPAGLIGKDTNAALTGRFI